MPDAAERRPLRRSVRQRLIVQLSEQASELQRQLEAADADVGATAGEGIVCLAVELRRFQRQQGEHRPASLAGRLLSIAHAQWEPWLRAALQLIQWLPSSIGERTGGPTGEPTAGASAATSTGRRFGLLSSMSTSKG